MLPSTADNTPSATKAFVIGAAMKIQGGTSPIVVGNTTLVEGGATVVLPAPIVNLSAILGDTTTHIVVTIAPPGAGSATFNARYGDLSKNTAHVQVATDSSFSDASLELEKDIPQNAAFDLGTFAVGSHYVRAYLND